MTLFFQPVDEAVVKRERAKAREFRQGGWWKNQIGRGRCFYCHESVRPAELTMDHKIPLIRGGRSTKQNLVPCCKACNNEKKHMLLSEWQALRLAEGKPLPCSASELT